jgi:hypothetical protein
VDIGPSFEVTANEPSDTVAELTNALAETDFPGLSLMVAVTRYVPATVKVCVGSATVLEPPSPNCQLYVYGGVPPPTEEVKLAFSGANP